MNDCISLFQVSEIIPQNRKKIKIPHFSYETARSLTLYCLNTERLQRGVLLDKMLEWQGVYGGCQFKSNRQGLVEAIEKRGGTRMELTGDILGIPYDLRLPTLARMRERMWNPEDPRIMVPRVFGAT
jgi:hypothetical protein